MSKTEGPPYPDNKKIDYSISEREAEVKRKRNAPIDGSLSMEDAAIAAGFSKEETKKVVAAQEKTSEQVEQAVEKKKGGLFGFAKNAGKEFLKKATFINTAEAWKKNSANQEMLKGNSSLLTDLLESRKSMFEMKEVQDSIRKVAKPEELKQLENSTSYLESKLLFRAKLKEISSIKKDLSPEQRDRLARILGGNRTKKEDLKESTLRSIKKAKNESRIEIARQAVTSTLAVGSIASVGALAVTLGGAGSAGLSALMGQKAAVALGVGISSRAGFDAWFRKNKFEQGSQKAGVGKVLLGGIHETYKDARGLELVNIRDREGNITNEKEWRKIQEGESQEAFQKKKDKQRKAQMRLVGYGLSGSLAAAFGFGLGESDGLEEAYKAGNPDFSESSGNSVLDASQKFEAKMTPDASSSSVVENISNTSKISVDASPQGAIHDLETLKGQLAERFKGVPTDKQPDTVRYVLNNPADKIAQDIGMYDPNDPSGMESAATIKGQSFVYSPDGKISLMTPGVEQGDVLLSDDAISMDGKIIKDGYGGKMFDYDGEKTSLAQTMLQERDPSVMPTGVDPSKIEWNPEIGRWEQKLDYPYTSNSELTQASVETPVYGDIQKEVVSTASTEQYLQPTQENIEKGLAFERDGRHYYYNHPGYPNGNPFGENLPVEESVQVPPQEAFNQPSQVEANMGVTPESTGQMVDVAEIMKAYEFPESIGKTIQDFKGQFRGSFNPFGNLTPDAFPQDVFGQAKPVELSPDSLGRVVRGYEFTKIVNGEPRILLLSPSPEGFSVLNPLSTEGNAGVLARFNDASLSMVEKFSLAADATRHFLSVK